MKAWRHRDAAAKLSSVPADTAKRKASVFVKGVKVGECGFYVVKKLTPRITLGL